MDVHIAFHKDMSSDRKYSISGGKEILIRAAHFTDIPQIVCFLKSVQITPENLDAKLSIKSKDSFKNSGGFFVVWNVEELSCLMQDAKNLILVVVANEEGEEVICGFLWCRLALDSILVSDWKLQKEIFSEERINKYNTALEKNLIFTAVECAIHPNSHGDGISFSIIYEMYNWLWKKGFLFSVLQVYRILGEYRGENFIKGEMPNEASISHIKKYGAVCIKKAVVPDQTIGNRRFKVSADVFLLDLENAVKRLKELVSKITLGKEE
ncbi:MAG: hypothetical protein PHI90_07665 [Clostridia bacterium]|nr:hypothetical protein [Clostridia bacterium]MDD4048678.1 hypothetical protein [Clostridia bacterium]